MKKSLLVILSLITAAMLSLSGCSLEDLNKDKTKNTISEIDKKDETKDTDSTKLEEKASEDQNIDDKGNSSTVLKDSAATSKLSSSKQSLFYTNEKLGFSLMLFDSWKGKYTVYETDKAVSFTFKPTNSTKKAKGSGRIFTIEMNAAKNTAVDNATWVKANGKDYLIGMPTDVTYFKDDPEYETFKKMSSEVAKIKTTFKEYKKPMVATTKATDEKFYGTWTIKKVLATGKVTAYSQAEIQQIIGKKLTFAATSASAFSDDIKTFGKKIDKPQYKKTSISKAKLQQLDPVAAPKLGLQEATITSVEITDAKGVTQCHFYIRNDKALILYGGGVYFELTKN